MSIGELFFVIGVTSATQAAITAATIKIAWKSFVDLRARFDDLSELHSDASNELVAPANQITARDRRIDELSSQLQVYRSMNGCA